jgi:hypothetical protein
MKKTIGFLAIAGLLGSVIASASQLPMPTPPYAQLTFSAQLDTINVDPNAEYLQNVDGGTIVRNVSKHTLRLTLNRRFSCPADRICAQVMPAPIILDLPIVDVREECGSVIYTAKRDMRPVDGNLEIIKLADHSTRLCEDHRRGTEVRLTTKTSGMDGFGATYSSSFAGDIMLRDFYVQTAFENSAE